MIRKNNDFSHFWPDLPADFCGLSLAQALQKLNLSAQDAAQALRTTPRTLRHYLKSNCVPWPALCCLMQYAGHVLQTEGFKHWQFHQGRFYAPGESVGLNAAEIKNADFLKGVYQRTLDENERLQINNNYLLSLVNALQQFKGHNAPFQLEKVNYQGNGTYIAPGGEQIIYAGYVHLIPAIAET